MKNNIVTQSQFYFSAFLSSLTALLFIDVSSSYQQILYIAAASLINFLIILFYKGKKNLIINTILLIYYFIISVLVMNYFAVFMSKAIKSGPYWAILIIITATIFFSYRKGFEALSRAGVIITFFVAVFLMYIFASTASKIQLQPLSLNTTTSVLPALVLLFPSATYASLGDNLKDNQKYPLIIYTISSFFVIAYLIFISSPVNQEFPLYYLAKKSQLGIFNGADFLLLAIISIAVIYFISLSLQSAVESKDSNIKSVLFLLSIFALSMISLYFPINKGFLNSKQLQFITAIIMIIALIINSVYDSVADKNKIYNKSKKNQ